MPFFVANLPVAHSVAGWRANINVGTSATGLNMLPSASRSRTCNSALRAAAGGGKPASLTECMTDALAEAIGVDSGSGGAEERFQIAGVRGRARGIPPVVNEQSIDFIRSVTLIHSCSRTTYNTYVQQYSSTKNSPVRVGTTSRSCQRFIHHGDLVTL